MVFSAQGSSRRESDGNIVITDKRRGIANGK
jgi:hypothetical protein